MRPLVGFLLVLLALGGCAGGERESGSPPEPARLFLAGDGELTVVDVDAARARVRAVPELAPGDPLYRIVRRGSKLVLFGFDTYVVDTDLRSPPRKLGDSWYFIPSSDPDRVWLAHLDPTSPETERAIASVREVSVGGRVTFPAVRRPPGDRGLVTAAGEALVFSDGRGALDLWNPSTREFTRRLPDATPGPVHGDLLAWCEDEGLALHVTDVESGDDRVIEPPAGFAAFDCWSGAFSPDGQSLALAAMYENGWNAERTLALVDLDDGQATPVDGSTVGPQYVFVAWSSSGDRVFMSGVGPGGRRVLLQYRLGEPGAVRIPVRVRDFYGMAAR
jgi:hypothetical protein